MKTKNHLIISAVYNTLTYLESTIRPWNYVIYSRPTCISSYLLRNWKPTVNPPNQLCLFWTAQFVYIYPSQSCDKEVVAQRPLGFIIRCQTKEGNSNSSCLGYRPTYMNLQGMHTCALAMHTVHCITAHFTCWIPLGKMLILETLWIFIWLYNTGIKTCVCVFFVRENFNLE